MRFPQALFCTLLFMLSFALQLFAQSSQGRKDLLASPTVLSFGTVPVGGNKTLTHTVSNSGSRTLTISGIAASGTGFKVQTLSSPVVLDGGCSYTFTVTYSPAAIGSSNGTVTVASDASNPSLSVPLSGSGSSAGQLLSNPSSMNFGNTTVGTSRSATLSLSSSGSAVTITGATSSNPEFTISGISFPFTLNSGSSVSFTAWFKAQSSGAASATIQFLSSASNSPTVEALTGTGTTVTQHAVTLSWKSSLSGAVGYNVYRGTTSSGPFTKINPVLDAASVFTDNAVSGGKTYYYVTTAVSSGGAESKFSNQAVAVVPGP